MRFLIVANYSKPHVGGVETLVDREVRLLSRAGHDVRLIVSACGVGELPSYPANVEVERIAAWNVLEDRVEMPWPIFSPWLVLALFRGVRWCDVIHAHGFLGGNTLAAFLIAAIVAPSRKRLLTEHAGRGWYRQRWKALLLAFAIGTVGRTNVRLATTSFACHERVVADLRYLAGDRGDVRHLLFPADYELFSPPTAATRASARAALGWEENRSKVLFVGRLSPRKGLDLLLGAQDERYDIALCGPGDAESIESVDGDRVQYFPPRRQEELVDLYHAADVLALPSRSEGNLVLVAQEALLCGLPVLLGEDAGLQSFIDCPGLYMVELQSDAIRAMLVQILKSREQSNSGRNYLERHLPSEPEWIEQLLAEAHSAHV